MSEDGTGPAGRIRDKLVETKRRWAEEGRLLTGRPGDPERDRLPPGQRLVTDFPVLDLGVQPDVPLEKARLRIDGLVAAPALLDWDALQAMPQQGFRNDIHCVTQWSRYDNDWQGVPVGALIGHVRVKDEARFVSLESHDGYTTNLALEDFARPENLLAFRWNGVPLTRQHGGPMRLVVPHLYFWKSPKWLRRIEFLAQDRPGFWEVRGYHHRGDPWLEERYG